MGEFFRVGKIVNTHGLKGEVKVMATTSDVNNFKRYGTVFINGVERTIEGVKFQKDRVILKIEGINSIDEAETYKTKIIEVPREREPELPEDTFYVTDLIGIHVFDTEGKDLGAIYDVIETKNNDVYWIREPKELLIPVLKTIVLDIDLDNEKIVIRPVGEWQDED
ncbi:ribosome maturation factor RimM [Clostridium sardiniense]|uniref:ribosome maturation factor RimM n=1 Tax=Clostridium sardiniense TaxID=29369 RepID=UPI00195D2C41|nr:ribosome maturation factor RimM [Clostridium sardiniense]MBM7835145.1 16S rRNA processing protein RimM [Clostridium sardiniense]